MGQVYPVHRLDEATSGLLLLARNSAAARDLAALFRERSIGKYYLALSDLPPRKKQGLIQGDMVRARRGDWKLTRSMTNPARTRFVSWSVSPGLRLYLLKPLPWFAFSQELKKSIDMVRRNGDDSMLIETSNGQMRLNLADILYLESIRHTIVIHTLEGKLSINGTLKDMEAKLADHHFFRSNSCYLVNLKHVTGVADQDCVMSNGEQLRVSRPRKKAFLAALTDYIGGGR